MAVSRALRSYAPERQVAVYDTDGSAASVAQQHPNASYFGFWPRRVSAGVQNVTATALQYCQLPQPTPFRHN